MKKIKSAIIGAGYISGFHIDAIRRLGYVDIIAINDIDYDLAKRKASEYLIPNCYKDLNELLSNKEIEAVHNCTPNCLHFEINKEIMKSGKHVFSEKPLALNSRQGEELVEIVKNNPEFVTGVNFNYRMNPLVIEMKQKIKTGDIGEPLLIHGSYLQDWLLFDTDYNWRVDSEIGGDSRCMADIGSHWIDLAQVILNDKIVEVCADLVIIYKKRKKPTAVYETFSKSVGNDYEEIKVKNEDYGSVLFKMRSGVHGVFYVSQVSAGRKCFLNIEIDGSKSSMYWNQEVADWMWIGNRDSYNLQVMRNPNLVSKNAKKYTNLAAGHPEGWNDAEKNNIGSFYNSIRDGNKTGSISGDFATFEEASYIIKIVEAILKSSKSKKWEKVVQ